LLSIDTERVTQAILDAGVSSLAAEAGAELVEAWINEETCDDEIIAVECGFGIRVDEHTWIIGVQDLIRADRIGIYGNEWKTTKEPSRYWNETKWLADIKSGPQIAVYALALNRGVFYENGEPFVLSVPTPVRERVRAVVKSSPPGFWPRDPQEAWQKFDDVALNSVIDAFRSKAETIRAARRLGLIPYQLPGKQCESFGRMCEYHAQCTTRCYPMDHTGFDSSDPAAKLALPFLGDDAKHPDTVILSASSYATYTRCMELGRRLAQAASKESNMALDTGSAFHAGVASFYRQLREQQKSLDTVVVSE
jgi:hypothetical protein